MRIFNAFAAVLAAALVLASCSNKAVVRGTVDGLSEGEVVVKLLDFNKFKVLDTLKTGKDGSFSYRVDVRKGDPDFVYLFRGETSLAGLLLQSGDRVNVQCDTLGNYTVEGSEESELLSRVDADFVAFLQDFEASENPKELTKKYIDFYRKSVRYILENSHSLTVIPVLYRELNPNLPIFGQGTDAIHFMNMRDSLLTVYPDSRYVKALEKEAARRENQLSMTYRIMNAETLGYPDLELPDQFGKKVKLSEVDAKVVMLYFWTAADATHKMQNLDVLKPVYQEFHNKGFEIFAVSLDTDKAVWARAVENQKLPWINVCDGLGLGSPSIRMYNVQQVPSAFFLVDGELKVRAWKNESTLRSAVSDLLK